VIRPVKSNPASPARETLLSNMKKIPITEHNWMNNNNVFERHPTAFFIEMERITTRCMYIESMKSVAPMATLPRGGKYCRKKPNLAGTNKIPCASNDRVNAESRCTLWGEDEDMLFA
jgi:hypothetical protein